MNEILERWYNWLKINAHNFNLLVELSACDMCKQLIWSGASQFEFEMSIS